MTRKSILVNILSYYYFLLDCHQHSVAGLMDVHRHGLHNLKPKKIRWKYKEFTKGETSFAKNYLWKMFFLMYSLFNVYVHSNSHPNSMIIQSAVKLLENLSTAVLIKINQSDLFRTQHFDNTLDPNVQQKKLFNEFSTKTSRSVCASEVRTLEFGFVRSDTFGRAAKKMPSCLKQCISNMMHICVVYILKAVLGSCGFILSIWTFWLSYIEILSWCKRRRRHFAEKMV